METLASIRGMIHERARECGREALPELIAVSKFQTIESMVELYRQGQRAFGENYVQELLVKKREFERLGIQDAEFHFIGKLQTNKVKQVLPEVVAIHSLDSYRILEEIEKRAMALGLQVQVYFQVNIDRQPSKAGFLPEELELLCSKVAQCRSLILKGLMTIPDPAHPPEEAFQRMASLRNQFGDRLGSGLSMGMSGDFLEAIRFGATSLRIGSALFGSRKN